MLSRDIITLVAQKHRTKEYFYVMESFLHSLNEKIFTQTLNKQKTTNDDDQ
jgi:hypothetical protein